MLGRLIIWLLCFGLNLILLSVSIYLYSVLCETVVVYPKENSTEGKNHIGSKGRKIPWNGAEGGNQSQLPWPRPLRIAGSWAVVNHSPRKLISLCNFIKDVRLWVYISKTQMITASSFFFLSSPSRVHFHKSISEPKRIHQQSSFRMRKEAHFPNGLIKKSSETYLFPTVLSPMQLPGIFHWPLSSDKFLPLFWTYSGNVKFPFLTLTQRDTGSALPLKFIYQSNLSTEYLSDQYIIHTT